MTDRRHLIVTADDFGIGPMTSQGILELAALGRVTSTVLLVTSPFAGAAVDAWRRAGKPLELGWHPCLTLDRPITPPEHVASLVDRDGKFLPLGDFLLRLARGLVRSRELTIELAAQYDRYLKLVGEPPMIINAHHHVHAFPKVGRALTSVLEERGPMPYIRRVREPWSSIRRAPGARLKRAFLKLAGAAESRRLDALDIPGNDWLAGITDDHALSEGDFFPSRLAQMPGRVIEWICHPGLFDDALEGRDGSSADGSLARRVNELALLKDDRFEIACREAGFTLAPPSSIQARRQAPRSLHAA